MKRAALVAGTLLFGIGALTCAFRGPLTLRLMEGILARNLGSDLLDTLPDGLHVVLCGAGSPLPDTKRSGPCAAVIAGDALFVVDSGSGSSRVMSQLRIPQGAIEAVLLTHFHSDHIDGLGELLLQRWVTGGKTEPLPVHGAQGVEEIVAGFNRAYALDRGYRVSHHGPEVVAPSGWGAVAHPFAAPEAGKGHVVLERGDLVVTAFRVDHPPIDPAIGYRFDYKGRSLVLSGDTNKSANLQHFAQGVDLLVHEALAPQLVKIMAESAARAGRARLAKIMGDILDYHASPVQAAEVARDSGAGHLLYYHVVPPLPLPPLEEIFLEGVDEVYSGPVTLGRDGTLVTLEANSDSIAVRELL